MMHLSGRSIGYFITAIALGNLTGTVFAERVFNRLGYAACLLLMAVFAGIGYGGIGFTNRPVLVVGLMVLEGVVVVFGQVAFNVLRQRLIPRHMIGRVYTTTRIFIRGAAPMGALLGGEIAQRHGPPAAILTAGVISIVVAIALGPSLVTALRDVKP